MQHRVRNAVRGLLSLDLLEGKSIHLGSKESVVLEEEDYVCNDVQRALKKGLLKDMGAPEVVPTVLVTKAEPEEAEAEPPEEKSNGKKMKRRKKAKE